MRTLLLAVVVALSGVALASGGGEAGHEAGVPLGKIALHALNLLLLLAVIAWALRGRVRDAMRNRAAGVRRAIQEANQLRKEALEHAEEVERRLVGFERELERMRREAEQEARAEHDAIVERARAEAELVERTAERTVRDELARARAELRAEAARLAVDLARKRVEAELGPDDERRLLGEFMTAVRGDEVADG